MPGKLKRFFTFPVEEKYRMEIERGLVAGSFRTARTACVTILAFELFMMGAMSLRTGGAFATPRRTAYFSLYLSLFILTLAILITLLLPLRRNQLSPGAYFGLETVYSTLLCLWGCGITLTDQLGGSGVSVFSYVVLSVAAFTTLKPWQGLIVFGSSFLFLNAALPLFPAGRENLFNNLVNSLFVCVLAFLVSSMLFRSRVSGLYDKMIIQKQYNLILEKNEQLNRLAHTDDLTHMNNRRYLEKVLRERRFEDRAPISGLLLDIDYFKHYNDTYGHIRGDECLKNVARNLLKFISDKEAFAVRYGGEEFFLCLLDCGRGKALLLAEELRKTVQRDCFPRDDLPCGCMTVSIGVYTVESWSPDTLRELIGHSDQALYQAKSRGRNRVEYFSEEPPPSPDEHPV